MPGETTFARFCFLFRHDRLYKTVPHTVYHNGNWQYKSCCIRPYLVHNLCCCRLFDINNDVEIFRKIGIGKFNCRFNGTDSSEFTVF